MPMPSAVPPSASKGTGRNSTVIAASTYPTGLPGDGSVEFGSALGAPTAGLVEHASGRDHVERVEIESGFD